MVLSSGHDMYYFFKLIFVFYAQLNSSLVH